MKTKIFFFARIIFAWFLVFVCASVFLSIISLDGLQNLVQLVLLFVLVLLLLAGANHLHQVELIGGELNSEKLSNRHRRQIEIPFEASIALPMLEQVLVELSSPNTLKISQDGLRFQAPIYPASNTRTKPTLWRKLCLKLGLVDTNHVIADATMSDASVSVDVRCEPESAAWTDTFFLDEGSNLYNAETITRSVSRRIRDFRRDEKASNVETATEKELAVAKLNLLHAQVEPHFLYNTLGSAKYLISSDPVKAEAMLDHLIVYLRHSLPRTESAPSTLGAEIERVRAYLDILTIRMGERLQVRIDVQDEFKSVAFPSMMLQTLVENSINHGLEPKTGGGTIWISVRKDPSAPLRTITVTVADDGIGFGSGTSGTGIGLKNVRERLRLAYGDHAVFTIGSNFPHGVAASITLPTVSARGSV